MLKKYSILALFFFAYTIVLAHSILPHHHHSDDHLTELAEAGHDHSSHHPMHEHKNLADEFGHYNHSTVAGDLYKQTDLKISATAIAFVYLLTDFAITIEPAELSFPVPHSPQYAIPIHARTVSAKGLRAPPLA